MGCNGEATTTGPGVCSAGLTTSISLISPSYVNPAGHGGMCEPQTRASPPVARKTGGRFLGAQALGRIGRYSLRTGKATWSQARGAQVGQEAL